MRSSRHHVSGAPRGQSLVEFTLIVPVLLVLLMGILDLGRAVAAYNSVSNAARSAARVAIVDQNEEEVKQAAEAEAFGLAVTVDFNPNVNADNPCVINVCMVRVKVEYRYDLSTPIIGTIIGPITVSSESQLAIERLYQSPP